MTMPLRKRIKRGVRSVVLVGLLRLISLIPLGPALRIGGRGGAIAYRLLGKTRRLALAHLARAFPEKPEVERQAIARQMFVNLGRAAMEITSIRSYDHRLDTYVEMRNGGLPGELVARGKGVIFVTGHLGNWELIARRIARAGIPNVAIAKRGDDARLMALIERWRLTGQVTTLWREDAIRRFPADWVWMHDRWRTQPVPLVTQR